MLEGGDKRWKWEIWNINWWGIRKNGCGGVVGNADIEGKMQCPCLRMK